MDCVTSINCGVSVSARRAKTRLVCFILSVWSGLSIKVKVWRYVDDDGTMQKVYKTPQSTVLCYHAISRLMAS